MKADNTDFSKSDIRILNHKGEPSFEGESNSELVADGVPSRSKEVRRVPQSTSASP